MQFRGRTLRPQPGPDFTPNTFAFTNLYAQEADTLVTSNIVTPTGFDTSSPVSVAGGAQYRIDGGTWTSSPGSLPVGSTIQLRNTTNAIWDGSVNSTWSLGNLSGTWLIQTKPDPALAIVGPYVVLTDGGTLYNGDLTSGAADPGAGTGVDPQVIMRLTTEPYLRVDSGYLQLRVMATAFGDSISSVRFSGACATTSVTTRTKVDVLDLDGNTHPEFAYVINLDVAAFRAIRSTGNSAKIYVEGFSSNGSITKRRLEWVFHPDTLDSTVSTSVWYREVANSAGIDAYGNARYTDFNTAITAGRAALAGGKTAGHLHIIETMDITPTSWDGVSGAETIPLRGYFRITRADAAVVTLARTTPNFANPTQFEWNYRPGIARMSWERIRFDTKNLAGFAGANSSTDPAYVGAPGSYINNPYRFDGCEWFTSDAALDESLFGTRAPPQRGLVGTNTSSFPAYYRNCTFRDGGTPVGMTFAINCNTYQATGDLFTGTPLVLNNYDEGTDSTFWVAYHTALTMSYPNSGFGTCTFQRFGGLGTVTPTGYFEVVANSVTYTFQIQQYTGTVNIATGLVHSIADLVASLNTRVPQMTATDTHAIDFDLAHLMNNGGLTAFGPLSISAAAPLTLYTTWNSHSDWLQGGSEENVILYGNVSRKLNSTTNFSGMLFNGQESNIWIENNILLSTNANTWGCSSGTHKVYRNNVVAASTTAGGLGITSTWDDAYSEVLRNCCAAISASASFPATAAFKDNVAVNFNGGAAPNNGSNRTGNVVTGGAFTAQFVDVLGDYRPAGTLSSQQFSYTGDSYDIFGTLRSASDNAGAVSENNASAHTWPTFP